MNRWKEVSLKDYCKTQYGYTTSATDKNTGVKFVRITDIVPDFVDWANVPYCEVSQDNFKKYRLNEGDIVAARTGATVGYAKQIRKGAPDAVFASYLVKLIPSEKIDKHFLGVLVESNIYREFIQIIAGGSAQPNANANDLTLFKFFLPPLPIQQRIASILSAYDDLIELNNQRIKLLEETAQELYKEWFVRLRFPGYKNVKFKKGIPESWCIVSVANAFETTGGGTPDTTNKSYWDGDINWYSPTDITASDTFFLSESKKKITERGLKESSSKLFPAGCLMMTSRATIAALGINTTPACTNQGFITCIPNDQFPKEYLYFWILSNKEYFEMLASGATFLEISRTTFRKVNILKPDISLIKKYQGITESIFQQIENLQSQNIHLRQIRDRLLPRLISGKLKIN